MKTPGVWTGFAKYGIVCLLAGISVSYSCSSDKLQPEIRPQLLWHWESSSFPNSEDVMVSGPATDADGKIVCITLEPLRGKKIDDKSVKAGCILVLDGATGNLLEKIEYDLAFVRPATIPEYPSVAATVISFNDRSYFPSLCIPKGEDKVLLVARWIRLTARMYERKTKKVLGEFQLTPQLVEVNDANEKRWLRPTVFLIGERAYCFNPVRLSRPNREYERIEYDLLELTPEDNQAPAKKLLSFSAERETTIRNFFNAYQDWDDQLLTWLHMYEGKCYITSYNPETRDFTTLAEGKKEDFDYLRSLHVYTADECIYDRLRGRILALGPDLRGAKLSEDNFLQSLGLGKAQPEVLWRHPTSPILPSPILTRHPRKRYLGIDVVYIKKHFLT